jgi:ferredoxin-nitrite reductase
MHRSQIQTHGAASSRAAAPARGRLGCVRVNAAAAVEPATDAAATADRSGLRFLPEAARARATDRKANKFEKTKVEKCGSTAWTEVFELAALIREGKTSWEALNLDDVDVRLKWAGFFHRRKQTPGRFMMRLKVRRRQPGRRRQPARAPATLPGSPTHPAPPAAHSCPTAR